MWNCGCMVLVMDRLSAHCPFILCNVIFHMVYNKRRLVVIIISTALYSEMKYFITARSELRKVPFFGAVSLCFLFVYEISWGTTEQICTKFPWKTCFVPCSDEFEGQGQRSRLPWTKNNIFRPFRWPPCGLASSLYFALVESSVVQGRWRLMDGYSMAQSMWFSSNSVFLCLFHFHMTVISVVRRK